MKKIVKRRELSSGRVTRDVLKLDERQSDDGRDGDVALRSRE